MMEYPDTSETDKINRVAEMILELIQKHYEQHGSSILLSAVGGALQHHLGDSFKNNFPDISLSLFIKKHLSDSVNIVTDPNNPLRISAQPAFLTTQAQSEGRSVERSQVSTSYLRYKPSVWTAFSKSLDSGQRRYISLIRPFRFIDTDASTPVPANHREIPASHIAPLDMSPEIRRGVIQENIEKWLAYHQLPTLQFQSSSNEVITPEPNRIDRLDALVRFLGSMNAEDRARLNIPADVLYRILQ